MRHEIIVSFIITDNSLIFSFFAGAAEKLKKQGDVIGKLFLTLGLAPCRSNILEAHSGIVSLAARPNTSQTIQNT